MGFLSGLPASSLTLVLHVHAPRALPFLLLAPRPVLPGFFAVLPALGVPSTEPTLHSGRAL